MAYALVLSNLFTTYIAFTNDVVQYKIAQNVQFDLVSRQHGNPVLQSALPSFSYNVFKCLFVMILNTRVCSINSDSLSCKTTLPYFIVVYIHLQKHDLGEFRLKFHTVKSVPDDILFRAPSRCEIYSHKPISSLSQLFFKFFLKLAHVTSCRMTKFFNKHINSLPCDKVCNHHI